MITHSLTHSLLRSLPPCFTHSLTHLEALLHDVAGELVAGVGEEGALDAAHDRCAILGAAVHHHVLHDVVAVLVADEPGDVRRELVQHAALLRAVAVLQQPLHDAAAVGVHGELAGRAVARVHDELDVRAHGPALVVEPLRSAVHHLDAIACQNTIHRQPNGCLLCYCLHFLPLEPAHVCALFLALK